jgi:hypothetical protein
MNLRSFAGWWRRHVGTALGVVKNALRDELAAPFRTTTIARPTNETPVQLSAKGLARLNPPPEHSAQTLDRMFTIPWRRGDMQCATVEAGRRIPRVVKPPTIPAASTLIVRLRRPPRAQAEQRVYRIGTRPGQRLRHRRSERSRSVSFLVKSAYL